MLLADMAVSCIGILLALKMNDIIRVLSMGYSLMASGCLVPFLGGVIWKKAPAAERCTAPLQAWQFRWPPRWN